MLVFILKYMRHFQVDATDYKEFVGRVAVPKGIQKAEADLEDHPIVHIFNLMVGKEQSLLSQGIEITSQELRIDVLIIYIIGVNAVLLDLHQFYGQFYGFPGLVRRKVTNYTF